MAEKKTKKSDKEPQKKESQKKGTPKGTAKEAPVAAVQEKEIKIVPRLGEIYKKDIVPALVKTFSYKSIMQVPKIDKIVVNMGVGAAVADQKIMDEAVRELETITGQKVSVRKSKKDISNFKLRVNTNIGAMVTLRKERMYEFLDRLINVALPRVRDFKGLSDKSFDGRGNYTLGIKEQIIFPEINADKITRVMGMDVTLVTTANTDNESFELLKAFGIPFQKKEVK
ncbi:MAG: 50S ribosomal protein L5 [Ignavibacteria bacterium]|nr:50S ribosomal protein L5 [Ignavibacteria bacterium]